MAVWLCWNLAGLGYLRLVTGWRPASSISVGGKEKLLRVRLLLCISIRGSVASANQFSSRVVRRMLTQGEMPMKPLSVDALKAKNECVRFPLTLMLTLRERIKGAPA